MQAKITKRAVDALILDGGAETALWDTELKGFGVRLRSGGVKVYVVRYRAGKGRGAPIRNYTIGRHGSPWTPEKAREEAERILGTVKNGADPAANRAADKTAETMNDLCQRFLSDHADAKRKERTAAEYRRLVNKLILPAIGKKKIKDVTRQDVAKLHHQHRATPYQANRVLALLSKLFNLAEAWGFRVDGTNPCRHVEKFPETARERFLSADELASLGDELAAYEASPYAVAAIKLLIFTGARLQEILTLEWDWIDMERGEARLPDSKTGAKTIHLPAPALAVLADLPRIEGNPFVIVGQKPGSHLNDLEKPWRAIRKAATVRIWRDNKIAEVAGLVVQIADELEREPTFAECKAAAVEAGISLPVGLANVRLHDLRHGFASVAASSGMGLPIIGKLLGHTQAQTTQRYAHLASDPVKAAAAAVADRIEAAMNSNRPGANVVELPKRKA